MLIIQIIKLIKRD